MKKNSDGLKMLKYFKEVKVSIIIISCFMVAYCVIGIINPIVSANLLTSLTEYNIDKTIELALIMIILGFLKAIVSLVSNMIYIKNIKQKLVLNIRKDMIKNLFEMDTVNFDLHSSGEFTNRITNDPDQVSKILSVVQFSLFNLITDFFVLVYVFYLNYIIGIVYIISILLIYYYEKNMLNKVKEMTKQAKKVSDKNTGFLNEIIRGVKDIKSLNLTKKTHTKIINGLDDVTSLEGAKSIKSTTSNEVSQLMKLIFTFIIILIGIFLVNNKLLTVTNLIIIFMYRVNIFDMNLCYRSIKEYLNEYQIASERIFEFMNDKKYPKESFGNKEIKHANGKIEIRHLSFSYYSKKVLDDISLVVKPNESIGIVGASGSGKTTLLNLLSKSYNVNNNMILIDDIDINDLTKESIRNNISIISQNPYIFNLSIKENLELVGDNITFDDIIDACKIAQLHNYIISLPDKYDTILGEGGTTLSGGQRQRLAIARALLKKSKIILFDEATSALDNVTQNELQKSLDKISYNYTTIVVAHRLSTIKNCDLIYVLDHGKIIAKGTHKELLKNSEHYKKLYEEEMS